MKFGFSIACGGHTELLLACVKSIRKHCGDTAVAITFDGFEAQDEDLAELRSHEECWYDTFTKQRGISAAWNNGIKICIEKGCDAVVVLNDDTEVGQHFLDDWDEFFKNHQNVKIACSLDRLTAHTVIPRITKSYSESWARDRLPPDIDLASIIYHDGLLAEIDRFRNDTYSEFAHCRMNGACFVMTKQAVDELGLFDENFVPPGCCEDSDMWLRCLTRFGPNSMGTFTRSFIHHLRSVTISNYPREWANSQIKKNSELYRSKWPRDKWGAIEDWFSIVNALPVGSDEPPYPGL